MSRFVSGGTNDSPTERDEAWLQAQTALDAKRTAAAEASRQSDGKSLYETLQANKAAKQEAFEESIRLKNQFRSLDEDEVDFLDSVVVGERQREAMVRREMEREVSAFRRLQEEVVKAAAASGASQSVLEGVDEVEAGGGGEVWNTTGPRKRKKVGRELGVVKIRRTSSSTAAAAAAGEKKSPDEVAEDTSEKKGSDVDTVPESKASETPVVDSPSRDTAKANHTSPAQASSPTPTAAAAAASLGLGAYSSDEDD